mgnify:CR=1 FL=1
MYIANILWVTKKPPKIFIAARVIARYPKMLEDVNMLSTFVASAAIIAPTIITEDIAFVTDIKGVCNDGVTLQTT